MEKASTAEKAHAASGRPRESLLSRKYVLPFILACVILACNQATGVNSIIGYNTNIFLQAGLSDVEAHWGYVVLTLVNFLLTIVGVLLVDRRGRKFLLSAGSAGIIVSLVAVGLAFRSTERLRVDCRAAVQKLVLPDQKLSLPFDSASAARLLSTAGEAGKSISGPALDAHRDLLLRRLQGGDKRRPLGRPRHSDGIGFAGHLRTTEPGGRLFFQPLRGPGARPNGAA